MTVIDVRQTICRAEIVDIARRRGYSYRLLEPGTGVLMKGEDVLYQAFTGSDSNGYSVVRLRFFGGKGEEDKELEGELFSINI
ncbi:MAG: hypothetical protein J4469_00735 [Candidatus Aenigmarchaeota archaeon]|nr:hypothetical protein [Candidatus Aenigmarchaeota archaeon]HLD38865.1 hypothetical protein [archaeon]